MNIPLNSNNPQTKMTYDNINNIIDVDNDINNSYQFYSIK
jgi:hypothetical protein